MQSILKWLPMIGLCLQSFSAQAQEFPGPNSGLVNIRTKCDPSKINVFSLVPLTQPIAPESLDWNPIWNDGKPFYVTPDENSNIRIEVCEQDDGSYKINDIYHRVLAANPENGDSLNINKKYDALYIRYEGVGFNDALFGDVEKLRLFTVSEFGGGSLKIKGWKIGDQSFVTVSSVVTQGANNFNHVAGILIGTLEMKDPFPRTTDINCMGRSWVFSESHLIGTAAIGLKGCGMQGAGNTTIKNVQVVTVKDSNEALPKELQNKTFTIKGDELNQLMDYDSTHHNWCDSFWVKVPELNATYISAGQVLESFPLVNNEGFAGEAVQYGNTWTILKKLEKGHGPCY